MTTCHEELLTLANLLCEDHLTDDQKIRLQSLLRSNQEHQSLFIDFVQLHGQLTWDAGLISESQRQLAEESLQRSISVRQPVGDRARALDLKRLVTRPVTAAAVCLVVAFLIAILLRNHGTGMQIAEKDLPEGSSLHSPEQNRTSYPSEVSMDAEMTQDALNPLHLDAIHDTRTFAKNDEILTPISKETDIDDSSVDEVVVDDAAVVAEINRLIRIGWEENNISAAAESDDHEWVRRTYLTLTGRIPSIEEVAAFVDSDSVRKQSELVDQLLEDQRTSENLAVIWTNLLIGRSNARKVDGDSLFAFLENQFAENRSWMETVGQLIAANGRSDQNGATNFLLAHLNDQATPATAVTARLFLGQQVHCTQCHDHPFSKERSQQEFWSLNAFFKQTERHLIQEPEAGGHHSQVWTLSDSNEPGMTFYDTLRGQKKAVAPEFDGNSVDPAAAGSRRVALVRLMASDSDHQVARAMVNRMWAQVFGYGFTNPIDDLGPHNPASHPELLEHLTQAFAQSDYDMRRLMRWLTMSDAFRLSSVQSEVALVIDDPQEGGTPLFSRAYPRHMGPEQVYESIRIAIHSVGEQPIESSIRTTHRRQWVDQFVKSYGTDENDENLAFEGNIAEALLMMNGQDLQDAIPLAAMEVTKSVREGSIALAEAGERLALATLNRVPTENEEKVFRNRYRALSRSLAHDDAMKTATEDMLWAYLNSSEFVSLH